jgi:uncharacterized membrane protein
MSNARTTSEATSSATATPPRGVGASVRSGRQPAVGLGRAVEAVAGARWLDAISDVAARALPDAMRTGRTRDILGGRWLGHPAHPMLTDFPLGMWMSASVLDLIPGDHAAASRRLVAGGLLATAPTVATGWSDWLHANRRERRIGVVHAATNVAAAGLYAASWRARRRDRRGAGIVLGLAGGVVATMGGLLGGHLSTATETALRNTADITGDHT